MANVATAANYLLASAYFTKAYSEAVIAIQAGNLAAVLPVVIQDIVKGLSEAGLQGVAASALNLGLDPAVFNGIVPAPGL